MGKSIKLKNNNYWDSDSVVHNKLSLKTLLNKINSSVTNYNLSIVETTDTTLEITVLTVQISETGIYLFTGFAAPNYYGQNGRELTTYLKHNNNNIWKNTCVFNSYAWTAENTICAVAACAAGDTITVAVKSALAVNWSFGGGLLTITRLK